MEPATEDAPGDTPDDVPDELDDYEHTAPNEATTEVVPEQHGGAMSVSEVEQVHGVDLDWERGRAGVIVDTLVGQFRGLPPAGKRAVLRELVGRIDYIPPEMRRRIRRAVLLHLIKRIREELPLEFDREDWTPKDALIAFIERQADNPDDVPWGVHDFSND